VLVVEDLSVTYGAVRAVRDVSIRVNDGEFVALLGPNGAGKTSLLSAIVGLVPVSSGRILLDGKDITRLDTEDRVRRGLTVTPEGRRVFANLTVAENLELGAGTRKNRKEIQEDLRTYLEMFPVLRERYRQTAGSLSGGEQQMLAIARSLMSRPKLIMLDEPSLGLAPRLVDLIFRLIVGLRGRGLTLLVVEQNAQEALKFADRAYVLSTGSLEFAGSASELRNSKELMKAYLGEDIG
jgi:branched-chain amino acid transport system ATP-binding protein